MEQKLTFAQNDLQVTSPPTLNFTYIGKTAVAGYVHLYIAT